MINAVALSLVLSSLVTACVFSPTRETQTTLKQDDVVIVKEGHRAVVVEYEKEGTDGNTKVSISPKPRQETHFRQKPISEEELSSAAEEVRERGRGPRELVCDAFGECKHRVSSAVGKAKESLFHATGDVSELAKETAKTAKTMGKEQRNVAETIESAKEKTKEKAEQGKEMAEQAVERAKAGGNRIKEGGEKVIESTKEKTKEKAEQGKEMAEQVVERAKAGGNRIKEGGEKVIESTKEKTKEKAEQGKEMAEQAVERAKAGGNRVKEGGEKLLKEILRRGEEVAAAMGWVVDVVHLLGFSTAYGICLWVTFVSSYVLSSTLPRQQFGMVQSRIYPVYFRVMAVCVCVALVGHLLGWGRKLFTSKGEMLQVYHLLASLLMILINALYLEPQATKVVFEKMKFEKEEGRGRVDLVSDVPVTPARGNIATPETILTPPAAIPERPDQDKVKSRIVKLNERLKKLNSLSSLLNIFTLVALTWHLVYLGQRLHLSC